ncbi:MAG TPA: hypothetical protein VIX89_20410 [Bryobacteraceae bacterium]
MATYVPYIDENVEHVGVSRLRTLNASNLRTFEKTLVIQDNDTPLAVLLRYEQFLAMQKQLLAVLQTIEVMTDKEEMELLTAGVKEMAAGRTKPLSEIRTALRRKARKGKASE